MADLSQDLIPTAATAALTDKVTSLVGGATKNIPLSVVRKTFSDADAFKELTGNAWEGDNRYKTLTANTAITLSGSKNGGALHIYQDATGNRTLSINGTPISINTAAGSLTAICYYKANGKFYLTVDKTIIEAGTVPSGGGDPGGGTLTPLIRLRADSGVVTSGANVTSWTDSVNGIVFNTPLTAKPQYNGAHPNFAFKAIEFQGNTVMKAATEAAHKGTLTIFIAKKDFATGTGHLITSRYNHPDIGKWFSVMQSGTEIGNPYELEAYTPPTVQTPHLLTVVIGATNVKNYINGVLDAGSPSSLVPNIANAINELLLGAWHDGTNYNAMAGFHTPGLEIYDGVLSDTDRASIETALMAEFNIP